MLLMEEITLTSVKTAVEWIFEANFSEEPPELLNLIITSPGGDLNAAFALIELPADFEYLSYSLAQPPSLLLQAIV